MNAVERSTFQKSEYMSLNSFSDNIKDSILWFVHSYFVSLNLAQTSNKQHRIDWLSDAIVSQPLTRHLKAHGMAGILTDEWRAFFVNEFLSKAVDSVWNHFYFENKLFDERKTREALAANYQAEKRDRDIAQARKILAESGMLDNDILFVLG